MQLPSSPKKGISTGTTDTGEMSEMALHFDIGCLRVCNIGTDTILQIYRSVGAVPPSSHRNTATAVEVQVKCAVISRGSP